MANFPIVHSTTKVDYTGSGAISANQELISSDWNATHVTLSAGAGLQIASDGGNPPTLTFSIGGAAGSTSFGDSLLPSVDNMFDIGSPTLRWKNEYVAGAISVGTLDIVNANTLRTVFTTQTNGTLLVLPDGLQIVLNGDFVPQFDSPSSGNIGGVTAKWLNAYFGGTVSAGGGFQTNAATSIIAGGNIVPTSDNGTPTLGTSSFRWGGIFVSDIQAGSSDILLTPNAAVRPTLANTNLKDLGSTGALWRSIYFGTTLSGGSLVVSGITNNGGLTQTGNLLPSVDITYNLGDSTHRWANVYVASGAVSAVGSILNLTGQSVNWTLGTNFTPPSDNSNNLGSATVRLASGFFGSVVSAGGGFKTNAITPALDLAANAKIRIAGTDLIQFDNGTIFPVTGAPSQNIAFGSATRLFSNGFFNGTMSAGSGFQTNTTALLSWGVTPSTLSLNGANLQMTGPANMTFLPGTDASFDIGNTTSARWRNATFTGVTSSGTFVTNSTFQFGSLVQGALVSYDLTLGLSGSFAIKNNSSVLLAYIDNSTGKFISAFTVSAATGFQTNAASTFGADILPLGDALNNLGSATKRWNVFTQTLNMGAGQNLNIILGAGQAVVPSTDNSFDIGTLANRWRAGYFGTTVSVGAAGASLAHTSTAIVGGGQAVNISPASGFNTVFTAGHIQPTSDNVADVGLAATRWRNVFAMTHSAATVFSTNTSVGIALGGAATATGTVSGTARVIPVTINGATWYIQAFPTAS